MPGKMGSAPKGPKPVRPGKTERPKKSKPDKAKPGKPTDRRYRPPMETLRPLV